MQNPMAGQYVYEVPPPLPSRGGRYSMGRPFDFDPVLFSAQEQEVLWKLRRRLYEEAVELERAKQATAAAAVAPRRPLGRVEALKWPRVVVRNQSICVPALEYSEAKDWRSHLVCFDSETKDVH